MEDSRKGNMSAQQERDAVGLSPQEMREINKPKSPPSSRQGGTTEGRGKSKIDRTANVLAASITAAAGVGLVATVEGALRSTPPQKTQESPEKDPLNRKPPEGVVLASQGDALQKSRDGSTGSLRGAPQPDAPAEPVLKKRVFLPNITREYREPEPPLYLREFGAPERGVIMRNRVEQGGGNPARVEMGDPELFENMMYLREKYGRPDLKLEINFYSTRNLLLRDPQAPRWIQENHRGVLNYDSWAGGNGTFENGSVLFRYTESTKTLQFYVTLPETFRGKVPTQMELGLLHLFFLYNIRDRIFSSNETGNSNLYPIEPGSSAARDSATHRPIIWENGMVTRSALWVKMETILTTGGK